MPIDIPDKWEVGDEVDTESMGARDEVAQNVVEIKTGPGMYARQSVGGEWVVGIRDGYFQDQVRIVRMLVKTIANDTLGCVLWDGSTEGSTTFTVDKPTELRHDYTIYNGLTSLSTVSAQTATASDGSTSETWKVTPDYIADTTEIWAIYGVSDNNWLDINVAGRAWAVA